MALNFLKDIFSGFGDDRIIDPVDMPENNLTEVHQYKKIFIDVNALRFNSMASTIELNKIIKRSIPEFKNDISEISKNLSHLEEGNSHSNEIESLRAEISELKKQMATMK